MNLYSLSSFLSILLLFNILYLLWIDTTTFDDSVINISPYLSHSIINMKLSKVILNYMYNYNNTGKIYGKSDNRNSKKYDNIFIKKLYSSHINSITNTNNNNNYYDTTNDPSEISSSSLLNLNKSSDTFLSYDIYTKNIILTIIDPIMIHNNPTRAYNSQFKRYTRSIKPFISYNNFDNWNEIYSYTFDGYILLSALSSDHNILGFITYEIEDANSLILNIKLHIFQFYNTKDIKNITLLVNPYSYGKLHLPNVSKITSLAVHKNYVMFSYENDAYSFRFIEIINIGKQVEFSAIKSGPLVTLSTSETYIPFSIASSITESLTLMDPFENESARVIVVEQLTNRRQYSYFAQLLSLNESGWNIVDIISKRAYNFKHSADLKRSKIARPIIATSNPSPTDVYDSCAILSVQPYITTVNGYYHTGAIEILNLGARTYFSQLTVSPNCNVTAVYDNNNEILIMQRNPESDDDDSKLEWSVAHELKSASVLKGLQILNSIIVTYDVEVTSTVSPLAPFFSFSSLTFGGLNLALIPFGIFYFSTSTPSRPKQAHKTKSSHQFLITVYESGRVNSIDVTYPRGHKLSQILSPDGNSTVIESSNRNGQFLDTLLDSLDNDEYFNWDIIFGFLLVCIFIFFTMFRSAQFRQRQMQFQQNVQIPIPPVVDPIIPPQN